MAIAGNTDAVEPRNFEQDISALKPRRRVLLAALAAGNTVAKSSQMARYSAPRAGTEALADIRKKLPQLMEAMGLSTAEILGRVRKKLDAQKTITATFMGSITDVIEVDDHGAQLDAIKLSLRLHGLLSNDSADGPSHLNITIANTIDVSKNEAEE